MIVHILPTTVLLLQIVFFVHSAWSVQFVCHDGSVATCGDGSVPILHEGMFARDNKLRVRSLCPLSCNVFNNKCDPTTAPTCIYPNPSVPNPRAACACRPGYKADNTPDGDTTKHWRLPVVGQEHRVWVAEGVVCNTLCGGYGPQSCMEVTMLGPDCVGDVVPGSSGGGGYMSKPYGQNSSTPIYVPPVESPTDTPYETDSWETTRNEEPSSTPDDGYSYTEDESSSMTDYPGESGYYSSDVEESSTIDDGESPTDSYDSIPTDPVSTDYVDIESPPTDTPDAAIDDTSSVDDPTETDMGLDDAEISNVPLESAGPSSDDWTVPDFLDGKTPDKGGPQSDTSTTDNLPAPFKKYRKRSNTQRRGNEPTDWKAQGEDKGWDVFQEQWNWYMGKLAGPHTEFKMDERLKLCGDIREEVSSGCENGIETQNLNCGLSKNGRDPKCQTSSLDTKCCSKKQAENYWCRGRWSIENFKLKIGEMEDTCKIITAGGRTAYKLGIYRNILSTILSIMKEGNREFSFLKKVPETQQQWLLWERDIRYLVGGDVSKGLDGLQDITKSLPNKGFNGVAWSKAIEAPMSKRLDDFMSKSIEVAFDVFAVKNEREFLVSLSTGKKIGHSLDSIRNWAYEYAATRIWLFLPMAQGRFNDVKDQASLDRALEDYKKSLQSGLMFNIARAWAVVVRADRVTK